MDNRQRNTLIGSVLVAGSIAGAVLYLNQRQKPKAVAQSSKHVSRDLTLKVLKEINGEMFSVSTNIAMIANQIKEKSRGRAMANEIKEFMLSYNPQLKNQIKKISDDICEKYGLEEKDLRHAVEVTFAEDREIKDLVREAKTTFDKAFQGVTPDLRTEIPAFLTPQLTLQLLVKIMKASLNEIDKAIGELRDKGVPISFENEEVARHLQDVKIDDIRKNVLIEEGLDKYQDHPVKIFQYATQKYASENPEGFNQKFMRLEMANHKAMEAVMRGSPDARVHIEAIGATLIEEGSSEPLFSAGLLNSRKKQSAIVGGVDNPNGAIISEEEEVNNLNKEIRKLQHQVSFQLKQNLNDSEFPQELVESAVNTVFKVFNTYNKDNNIKNEDDNILLKPEDLQAEPVAVASGNASPAKVGASGNASPTKVHTTVEITASEVPGSNNSSPKIKTVTHETTVIESESEHKVIETTETVVEKH